MHTFDTRPKSDLCSATWTLIALHSYVFILVGTCGAAYWRQPYRGEIETGVKRSEQVGVLYAWKGL